jgi:hypothetical protein
MHARKVSHKIIDNACSWMHAARRNVLAEAVLAAVKERRLTVELHGQPPQKKAGKKPLRRAPRSRLRWFFGLTAGT